MNLLPGREGRLARCVERDGVGCWDGTNAGGGEGHPGGPAVSGVPAGRAAVGWLTLVCREEDRLGF